MKSYFPSVLLTLGCVFLLSSFILISVDQLSFTINIEGVETLDLKKGLTPSELSRMTIDSDDADVSVSEFQVVLARGNRPVAIPAKLVKGNSYDLAEYESFAKSGDRLVVALIEINGLKEDDISAEKRVIIIPIK